MTNAFRTIIVPEQSVDTFNMLSGQLGQEQMFLRKLALASSPGQASHRIASGVVDDVIDIIFGGGVACQDYLATRGVMLTLPQIEALLQGTSISANAHTQVMSDLGLVFQEIPEA